jgi:PDZ domain-containing protein
VSGGRERAFVYAIFALAAIAALSVVPTPFFILAPGTAVDLSTHVAVEGHAPPRRRYFLTDVSVTRASVLLLAAGLLPGSRIVRRDRLVPPGESARAYDLLLADAMDESQATAAIVAERAAGYRVPQPQPHVVVTDVAAGAPAGRLLARGDELRRIRGRTIASLDDITRALAGVRGGQSVAVEALRGSDVVRGRIAALPAARGARLGIFVRERVLRPRLPVPVRFSLGDISGSSGGLMFALQIYGALRGTNASDAVAGTGTIAADGRVGPIEGTLQKLIAARRAGARVFLVPRANYGEVANETGVRVVPVDSFADALARVN